MLLHFGCTVTGVHKLIPIFLDPFKPALHSNMWWTPLAKESVRNLFLWSYINFSWTANPWSPYLKSTGMFLGKKKENKFCPKQFCFLTQKVFKNPTSSPIFIQAKCLVTSQENIKAMQRTAIKIRKLTYHKGTYLPHELKQAKRAVPDNTDNTVPSH